MIVFDFFTGLKQQADFSECYTWYRSQGAWKRERRGVFTRRDCTTPEEGAAKSPPHVESQQGCEHAKGQHPPCKR